MKPRIYKTKLRHVLCYGSETCTLIQTSEKMVNVFERKALRRILGSVDIDETLLTTYSQRAQPLVSDYLARRKTPLRADIYKGSIDSSVECLLNTDVVIGIEIIEHLYPQVLENVPYNVFGYIQPKLAIFTTPNSEFNVLFDSTLPNGFRHYDHKFEWTRSQFQDWCNNICLRFPNYQVTFMGVGQCPASKPDVGYVTQIGIFIRNDIRGIPLAEEINPKPNKLDETAEYKLIYSVEFPFSTDQRTFDEKLLDDLKYHIFRYLNMGDRYYNDELNIYEIPMQNILDILYPSVMSLDELKTFLITNSYVVSDNNMILIDKDTGENDVDSASSSAEEDNDYDDSSGRNIVVSAFDEFWD